MSNPAVLQVRQLSYRYPTGQRALDGVNFTVAEGERVAVVGPSGAGKSTLLLHLNGLLPETVHPAAQVDGNASVIVGELPMCREHLREIRRQVGLLFQDPDDQLFCPTVREDVAFGPLNLDLPAEEVERRVAESLASVGMSEFSHRSTLQLSLGERKRICLAGVLACQPAVLALDEPFSNLDPRARRSLTRILREFQGSQVIATHDLDLVVELCSRVILMDEGRIHADGPPESVLSDRRLMDEHGLEVPLRLQLKSS